MVDMLDVPVFTRSESIVGTVVFFVVWFLFGMLYIYLLGFSSFGEEFREEMRGYSGVDYYFYEYMFLVGMFLSPWVLTAVGIVKFVFKEKLE